MLCLAIADAAQLLTQADIGAAITVEGVLATDRAFAADPAAQQQFKRAALRTVAGVTLIEVMVVVVILSILASFIILEIKGPAQSWLWWPWEQYEKNSTTDGPQYAMASFNILMA